MADHRLWPATAHARLRPAAAAAVLLLALALTSQPAAAAARPSPPLPSVPLSDGAALAPPDADGVRRWVGIKTLVSWSPRAFHLAGFLTAAERAHIVALAAPRLASSRVLDPSTSAEVASPHRTSRGAWLPLGATDVLLGVERRLELLLDLPLAHQESTQVLAYGPGAFYRPHSDLFFDNASLAVGGQRVATVVMYLTTPDGGGETVFPDSAAKVGVGDDPARPGPPPPAAGWSACARGGAAVAAVAGDAVLFYSTNPDGTACPARHASCPVTAGEKWVATKWVHVRPYGAANLDELKRRRVCVDVDPACGAWAAAGECEGRNKEWMLGSCRRACRAEGCPAAGTLWWVAALLLLACTAAGAAGQAATPADTVAPGPPPSLTDGEAPAGGGAPLTDADIGGAPGEEKDAPPPATTPAAPAATPAATPAPPATPPPPTTPAETKRPSPKERKDAKEAASAAAAGGTRCFPDPDNAANVVCCTPDGAGGIACGPKS